MADTTNQYMKREVAQIRERTSEHDANNDLENGWSLVSMHTAYDQDSKAFAILYVLEERTMNELTIQDIDLLMRALDALEFAPYHKALMSGLAKSMANKGEGGEAIAEEVTAEAAREAQPDKDDIILVKAKLIAHRREQEQALLFTGVRHEHL